MAYQPKPIYMPWNEEEFQADIDVRAMSCGERNAYRCLLQSLFWQSSRPYVQNEDKILQISANCATMRDWRRASKTVLRKFKLIKIKGVEYWENPRASRDWKRIQQERERLSEYGKKSAQVKRGSNPGSTEDQPGIVKGKDIVKEKGKDEESERVFMRQLKELAIIAGKVIGNTRIMAWERKPDFKDRVEAAYGAYGESRIEEDFGNWCEENRENPPKFPISEYFNNAVDVRLGSAKPLEKDPRVESVTKIVFSLSKRTPTPFSIEQLLERFTEKEIELAFQEYVDGLEDRELEYAVKNFFQDGGGAAIILARQSRVADAKMAAVKDKTENEEFEKQMAQKRAEFEKDIERIEREGQEAQNHEGIFG